LGDAGPRAILEFVGVRDRVRQTKAQKPKFDEPVAAPAAGAPAAEPAPAAAPPTEQ
jgi:hypothetical protein